MTQYAVLGSPIQHSLSPRIFKLFAEQTQDTLDYQAFLVEPQGLPTTLVRLRLQGYQGVNLTAPLKEIALPLVAACSERARVAKAINVLSFQADGTLYGDNSDGLGFIRDLTQRQNYKVPAKTVLILGAGGAARGILAALLEENPGQVVIYNRTPAKARQLIEDFPNAGCPLLCASWPELQSLRFDLIVNCTSAGQQGLSPRLPENLLNPAATCYDLAYGKNAQPFLAWAQTQGAAHCHDGLGMLVEQAAAAFFWWRQKYPTTAPILDQLKKS